MLFWVKFQAAFFFNTSRRHLRLTRAHVEGLDNAMPCKEATLVLM